MNILFSVKTIMELDLQYALTLDDIKKNEKC